MIGAPWGVPLVGGLGAACRWSADLFSELVGLVIASASPAIWRRAPVRREFVRQMVFTALHPLPFVLIVGAIAGAAIVVRIIEFLRLSGSSDDLSPPLLLVLLRYPGPLMVNLIVLGRSGPAIVAELAGLRASGDARLLTSHGIDLFHFVVVPRALATTVAVVGLVIFFNTAALFTAVLTTVVGAESSLGYDEILNALARIVAWGDGLSFMIRSALPAALGGLIACRVGLSAGATITEVARSLPVYFAQSFVVLVVVSLLATMVTL